MSSEVSSTFAVSPHFAGPSFSNVLLVRASWARCPGSSGGESFSFESVCKSAGEVSNENGFKAVAEVSNCNAAVEVANCFDR